jgi:hypothetical protein
MIYAFFTKPFSSLKLSTRHFDLLKTMGKEITKDAEEKMKRLVESFKEEKGFVKKA